jgi:hypothetical protein
VTIKRKRLVAVALGLLLGAAGVSAAPTIYQTFTALLTFQAMSSDPATPPSGYEYIYVKDIGGRLMPKWIGPSGVDTPVQPFIGFNRSRLWAAGGGTSATTVITASGGGYTASASTYAQTTPATGSLRSKTRFATLASSTTAGNVASVRTPQLEVARETGFFYTWRGGIAGTMQTGQRGFFGLWASASAATNVDPTTSTTAHWGICFALNTGNWKLCWADGTTAGNSDLGASYPLNTTDLIEVVAFVAPGGSSISYRITNLSSSTITTGTSSTNIPGSTAYLAVQNWMTNNATAAAVTFAISSMYLESDY